LLHVFTDYFAVGCGVCMSAKDWQSMIIMIGLICLCLPLIAL